METQIVEQEAKETKASLAKETFSRLLKDKQFDYGNKIPCEKLLAEFGIELLNEADADELSFDEIKERLTKDTLESLGVFNLISGMLLNEGKHIYKKNEHYNISLPSENIAVVNNLMRSSQKRLAKARKLLNYTPSEYKPDNNALANKLLLAESSKIH